MAAVFSLCSFSIPTFEKFCNMTKDERDASIQSVWNDRVEIMDVLIEEEDSVQAFYDMFFNMLVIDKRLEQVQNNEKK